MNPASIFPTCTTSRAHPGKHRRLRASCWMYGFKDNVFGIPGDEDGGGMTAFVVFSFHGLYPVTPGLPVYTSAAPYSVK